MGIRFLCHACDRKLNVKSFLAGKKGICPHCGAGVRIPTESQIPSRKELLAASQGAASTNGSAEQPMGESISIATTEEDDAATATAGTARVPATPVAPAPAPVAAPAPADPIDENPDAIWYVRPPSGGQYGPADGDVMRRWISEKRVSAEGLVWREGWPEWKKGAEVFPQLSGTPVPPIGAPATAATPTPKVASDSGGDAESAPSKDSPSSYAARARKKKKGAGIMAIVILGLLIAVLAVTLVLIVVNKS